MKAKLSNLQRNVAFLTGIRPFRNHLNLESLERVCSHLSGEFARQGYSPEEQKWKAKGREYKNIIASYDPDKSRRLIVGAHYDVAGDQPGADDNASAVAGLLETARMVAEERPDLAYGIDFVAYCLEEPPHFRTHRMGSYVHAKSLHQRKADVLGMICYEMIGYFSDEPGSQQVPPELDASRYPDVGNFIVVVGIKKCSEFNGRVYGLMCERGGIPVERVDFPKARGLAGMSDQRNYWPFGYDALMINDTSFLRNPHYHQESDTMDTLDFVRMARVVDCCYHAVVHL